MEGPTPVSALIHAATMVTAGIYMVLRCSPIFEFAPTALVVVAFFGALVSLAIPTKKTIALNYCIYALTFAGACISTIEPGPFSQPGNGYFASW